MLKKSNASLSTGESGLRLDGFHDDIGCENSAIKTLRRQEALRCCGGFAFASMAMPAAAAVLADVARVVDEDGTRTRFLSRSRPTRITRGLRR